MVVPISSAQRGHLLRPKTCFGGLIFLVYIGRKKLQPSVEKILLFYFQRPQPNANILVVYAVGNLLRFGSESCYVWAQSVRQLHNLWFSGSSRLFRHFTDVSIFGLVGDFC